MHFSRGSPAARSTAITIASERTLPFAGGFTIRTFGRVPDEQSVFTTLNTAMRISLPANTVRFTGAGVSDLSGSGGPAWPAAAIGIMTVAARDNINRTGCLMVDSAVECSTLKCEG